MARRAASPLRPAAWASTSTSTIMTRSTCPRTSSSCASTTKKPSPRSSQTSAIPARTTRPCPPRSCRHSKNKGSSIREPLLLITLTERLVCFRTIPFSALVKENNLIRGTPFYFAKRHRTRPYVQLSVVILMAIFLYSFLLSPHRQAHAR